MIYVWTNGMLFQYITKWSKIEMVDKTVIIPAQLCYRRNERYDQFCRSGGDMGYVISRNAWMIRQREAIITLVDLFIPKNSGTDPLQRRRNPPGWRYWRRCFKVSKSEAAEVIDFAKGKDSCPNHLRRPKTECWRLISQMDWRADGRNVHRIR